MICGTPAMTMTLSIQNPGAAETLLSTSSAPSGTRVMGTIDVESERANAFSDRDREMIEQCAQAALPLWLLG